MEKQEIEALINERLKETKKENDKKLTKGLAIVGIILPLMASTFTYFYNKSIEITNESNELTLKKELKEVETLKRAMEKQTAQAKAKIIEMEESKSETIATLNSEIGNFNQLLKNYVTSESLNQKMTTKPCPKGFTSIEKHNVRLGCMQNNLESITSGQKICTNANKHCFEKYGGLLPSFRELSIARSFFANAVKGYEHAEHIEGLDSDMYGGKGAYNKVCSGAKSNIINTAPDTAALNSTKQRYYSKAPFRCYIPTTTVLFTGN